MMIFFKFQKTPFMMIIIKLTTLIENWRYLKARLSLLFRQQETRLAIHRIMIGQLVIQLLDGGERE
ncbi:hypothetical protein DX130_04375 [Paenibacillus paeoniae]|uniref:Uncharacterized protein n=1 Tax=Paenibacillus paeoniae TaxID=2292705 RepID=A0A371PKU1_9BACL|nr:hypothetical protein DX130_04375 [Paenibacillus paeoniae]